MIRIEIDSVYKTISYVTVSALLVWISDCINSNFIDTFNDGFISLITTLFAINVASTSIVFSKLKEIQLETGAEFTGTRRELGLGFKSQILLIGVTFIIQVLYNSSLIDNETFNFIIKSSTVIIFIYFLDITYDLGKVIMELFSTQG